MRDGGWFAPPLSPQAIAKVSDVFLPEKHRKTREIYAALIARSRVLGGVTKIDNRKLARYFKLSERQVQRHVAMLVKHGLIARLVDYHLTEAGPRTDRMFIVWAAFYTGRCRAVWVGWGGFKRDARVRSKMFDDAIRQIPLKYKISAPFVGKSRTGSDYEILPEIVDLRYLRDIDVIDDDMMSMIQMFEELVNDPVQASAVETIMGSVRWYKITKNRQPEAF